MKRYLALRIKNNVRQYALSDVPFAKDSRLAEAQLKRIPNKYWISSYFLDGYKNVERRIAQIYRNMESQNGEQNDK